MHQKVFDDPIRTGRVFLCHSCANHKYANYLFNVMSEYFSVWYSCAGSMKLADPVLPRKELGKSDVVLFLASPESMWEKSISSAEFSVAQILSIKSSQTLVIVALEKFEIPLTYRDLLFERFCWTSRKKDTSRIVVALADRLRSDAGLIVMDDRNFGKVWLGGRKLERIVEYLQSRDDRSAFLLSAPMQHYETLRIIETVKSWNARTKGNALTLLEDIYFDTEAPHVARENAIYVYSQVVRGSKGLTKRLKRRYPGFESPFLYRGFHISLSNLGDTDSMDQYVQALETETVKEWSDQRGINNNFHLLYYGGLAGTLNELRTSIKEGRPRGLLRLNVFTLGELSSIGADCRLLEHSRPHLKLLGVPHETVSSALQKIRRRGR